MHLWNANNTVNTLTLELGTRGTWARHLRVNELTLRLFAFRAPQAQQRLLRGEQQAEGLAPPHQNFLARLSAEACVHEHVPLDVGHVQVEVGTALVALARGGAAPLACQLVTVSLEAATTDHHQLPHYKLPHLHMLHHPRCGREVNHAGDTSRRNRRRSTLM